MRRRGFLVGASCASLATLFNLKTQAAIEQAPTVAAFEARRKFLPTPFGRIAYVEQGHGRLALFLHAWPLNGYEWRHVLGPLSHYRRCVALDFMGLGYSEPRRDQELSPLIQADMLAAFITGMGAEQADIVGNDSGGLIAQILAARQPGLVRTLLLTNCDVQRDNPPPSFLPLVQAAKSGALAEKIFPKLLADLDLARSPRGLGVGYIDPQTLTRENLDYYLAPLVGTEVRRALFQQYTVSLGQNELVALETDLRRFESPVRVVWGAADTVFSAESADILSAMFKQSRGLRRIPDAKLYFPEEKADAIIEEARSLWTPRPARG